MLRGHSRGGAACSEGGGGGTIVIVAQGLQKHGDASLVRIVLVAAIATIAAIAGIERLGGLARGGAILLLRGGSGRALGSQGAVKSTAGTAKHVEMLAVLTNAVEQHVTLISQTQNVVLLLLYDLLAEPETLV